MAKSRLDQLWENLGGVSISDTPSGTPSSNVILTEDAVRKLLGTASGGITRFEYRQHPTNVDKMQLIGYDANDYPIATVDVEKSVNDILCRPITQEDIDSGVEASLGTLALELVYEGKTQIVPMSGTNLKGSTTNTVSTEVVKDTIKSNLVIDEGNNNISSVEIKTSNNGVYNKLNIDNSQSITLKETNDGLTAVLHLQNSDLELKFEELTWEEYNALDNKDTSTMYLISNKPLIYFNNHGFGSEADIDTKLNEFKEEIQTQIDSISGGLKSVALEDNELVLVYTTTEGETTTRVDLSKFIDVYQAGKNITIKGNVISADVPVKSVGITQSGSNEIYLSLNEMTEAVPFPMAKQNSNGNYQCGIMSKEDKEKLDNLPSSMAEYKVKSLGIQKSTGGVSLLINGTNELPIPHAAKVGGAYETGLMERTDKEKLDSIDITKLVTTDNIENYAPSFTELDGKANVDSVYTKEEVDNLIPEIPVLETDTLVGQFIDVDSLDEEKKQSLIQAFNKKPETVILRLTQDVIIGSSINTLPAGDYSFKQFVKSDVTNYYECSLSPQYFSFAVNCTLNEISISEIYYSNVIQETNKGKSNGVASLGANAKVPIDQLPIVSQTQAGIMSSQDKTKLDGLSDITLANNITEIDCPTYIEVNTDADGNIQNGETGYEITDTSFRSKFNEAVRNGYNILAKFTLTGTSSDSTSNISFRPFLEYVRYNETYLGHVGTGFILEYLYTATIETRQVDGDEKIYLNIIPFKDQLGIEEDNNSSTSIPIIDLTDMELPIYEGSDKLQPITDTAIINELYYCLVWRTPDKPSVIFKINLPGDGTEGTRNYRYVVCDLYVKDTADSDTGIGRLPNDVYYTGIISNFPKNDVSFEDIKFSIGVTGNKSVNGTETTITYSYYLTYSPLNNPNIEDNIRTQFSENGIKSDLTFDISTLTYNKYWVNIQQDTALTITNTNNVYPLDGQVHILIYNSQTSDVTVAIPSNASYCTSLIGDSLTVPSSGYAEINILAVKQSTKEGSAVYHYIRGV